MRIQDNYIPHYSSTYNASSPQYYSSAAGLGLFNCQTVVGTYKNITLTGNVKSDVYQTRGSIIEYYKSKTDNVNIQSVGSLFGTLSYLTENSLATNFNNVLLYNVDVKATKHAGGLIGFIPLSNNYDTTKDNKVVNISNTKKSEKISVYAGLNAGGLIGFYYMGNLNIDFNSNHFDITKVESACLARDTKTNNNDNDWDYGCGGLIGVCRGNNAKGVTTNKININNVIVGNSTDTTVSIVKCDSNPNSGNPIYVGGVIGILNRAPLTMEGCDFYNINVTGKSFTGGLVGWAGTASGTTIKRTNLSTNSTVAAKIQNTNTGSKGLTGGYIGNCKSDMQAFTLQNCSISGYEISHLTTAGGVLGDWSSGSYNFIVKDFSISDCTIKANNNTGGLAGTYNKKTLQGYNIIAKDLSFGKASGTGTATYCGYIAGARGNDGTIQIVGFSRQGNIQVLKLVGNKNATDTNANLYNTNGYVFFADYDGKSLTPDNTTVSSINLGSTTAVDGMGASPYVTINPAITLDSNIGLITGDGISNSAISSIMNDSSNKKYTVANLDYFRKDGDINTDWISTFQNELGDVISGKKYDFPMLVVNDTNTAETVVNNYLRMLTNTGSDVDFSTKNNGINATTNIGLVTIRKCTYNKSNGTFTISSNANDSCLYLNGSTGDDRTFAIRQVNGNYQYDTANTNGQFTLIDIAFKDPSTTGKVAYHLYVPVIVKKLLEYNFDISAVSGSTYDQTLYTGNRGNNVVENLGAPVTMEFEYNYLRNATEWAESDNAYGLDKYLSFDPQTVALFDNTTTKLVLVDINRGGKEYYLSKWSDGYDTTTKLLNLQAFKDVGGTAFAPVTFANMLSEQKISGDQTLKEKYYLTIFTAPFVRPKLLDENDEPILDENGKEQIDTELVKVIHYSVTTHNIGTTEHPTRRVDCADQPSGSYHYATHLVIGDFYTNVISVATPSNATERMSNNNKTVTVNISASIDLVNNGTRRLLRDYLGKSNVTIYQSLLASFEKYNNSALYDKGLTAIDGYNIDSYTLTGQNGNIPITDRQILRTANFIEFQNNTDISDSLQNGSVTSAVQATLEFNSENTRKAQFPYRTNGQNTGALVIGYSNISSSKTNTAYSVVSESDDDTNNKMYYVESEESAELQYYADYSDANKQNQLHEQLGINAREIESSQTKSFIQTEGRYDTTGLLNASKAQYLECSLKLYQKQESGSYSEVPLDNYLKSLSVIGGKTPVYTNLTTHTYIFNIGDVAQFENEQYVYKIPITFNAITGNQTNFKDTYYYANYKVELTVSLFDHNCSTDSVAWSDHMGNSTISDWVIYTNARVYTDLINTSAS